MQGIATECVTLVARQFGRRLDWSLASLDELDAVCADLLAEGPLNPQRQELWWKLIRAYTGEVLVRVYGGQWITHEQAPGSFAVSVRGMTALPFAITAKILHAEPTRALPHSRACCPQSLHAPRRTTPASNLRQQNDRPIDEPATHIMTAYVLTLRGSAERPNPGVTAGIRVSMLR